MSDHYTQVPTQAEYFALADQLEGLARKAKTEAERQHYQLRADMFRRLGNARLETNEPEQHFRPKRTRR